MPKKTQLSLTELQREVKLCLAQDQGAGGNLTEQEIIDAMYHQLHQTIARYGKIEQTVVLCTQCSGKGHKTTSELVDYHKRDYMDRHTRCYICNGSGRVERLVITCDRPFVDQTPELLKFA